MNKSIQAIVVGTVSILRSKILIDPFIGRSIVVADLGSCNPIERKGADGNPTGQRIVLFNTNATSQSRLEAAIAKLTAPGAFDGLDTDEKAMGFRNEVLNAASISFSVPVERRIPIVGGDDAKVEVQEYFSEATGAMEIGLRFRRIEEAKVAINSRNNSELNAMLASFGITVRNAGAAQSVTTDPFADVNVTGEVESDQANGQALPAGGTRASRRRQTA